MSDIYDITQTLNKKSNRLSPLRKFLAARDLNIETVRLDKQINNSTVSKPQPGSWVVNELIEMNGYERAKISYTDETGETTRIVLTTEGVLKENLTKKVTRLQKHVYNAAGSMFEL